MRNEITGTYAVGISFISFVNVERDDLLRHVERWEHERQLIPT